MDLIVASQPDVPSSLPSNCFVSLPSSVVASLSQLKPFASLVVIRLVQKSQTNREALYVACSGGTTDAQDQIAFHPNHATALGLRHGDVVTATVAERISKNPRRCVDIAYLRPVSYEQCETEPSAPQAFQLASEHFTALNVTANFLETSVLSQMRLVYQGLVVPIQLPAKECIHVRIKSMETSGDHKCPYALLTPSSQLSIEPPPSDSSRNQAKKVFAFFRALYMRSQDLQTISPLFRTHAILPADGSSNVRFAYVARKDVHNISIAVPIAFICHEAIPKRHIWVPSHVCHSLSLAPLAPLLVEEVYPFPQGDVDLFAEPSQASNAFPSFSELKEQRGVYYNSMLLRGLRVRCMEDTSMDTDDSPGTFSWDTVDANKLPEHENVEDIFVDVENKILEDVVSNEERMAASSKRQMVNGFCSFSDQTMRILEPKTSGSRQHRKLFLPLLDQGDSSKEAWSSLSQTSKEVVRDLMKQAHLTFRKRRGERVCPRSLIIQGTIGTGKTYVCSTVASILRDLALVRTVWIRCKRHSKDAPEASVARIRSAFHGAVDGGPGLIVFDDIDSWIHIGEGTSEDKMRDKLKDIRGNRICATLEHELKKKTCESVLVLLVCREFKELNKTIRCPGLIHSILSISLPGKSDRAFLLRHGLKQMGTPEICNGDEKVGLSQEATDYLASVSDGFAPHDIRIALYRMGLHSKNPTIYSKSMNGILDRMAYILKNMVPVNRIGIKFTTPSLRDELSWERVGALSHAKQQLWEALQLPLRYPNVFTNAPLRLPHGILLFGPPGCGKTMLAKTAAAESKMRFVVVRGPELLSKYVGESEAEVRRAFERAAQAAPCVLLFDEFDALAPRRGGYGTGVSDRVVNTLLACMDGAERLEEGVYVLATTSRPEVIDPALLRPGRLDKWIYLNIPNTTDERFDILKRLYLNYFEKSEAVETILEQIAKKTDGYTGADLGSIINDAYMSMPKKNTSSSGATDISFIHGALQSALFESRPSLSKSQRHAYQKKMARFSSDGEFEDNGNDFDNLMKPFQTVVALK